MCIGTAPNYWGENAIEKNNWMQHFAQVYRFRVYWRGIEIHTDIADDVSDRQDEGEEQNQCHNRNCGSCDLAYDQAENYRTDNLN